VHALDEYLESLDLSELSRLDGDVQAELGHVLPSLSRLGRGRAVADQHERYRSHRAVRALLEHLAAAEPLVLILDDIHWADAASVELLGALLRRPPLAPVLTAVALRPHQAPDRLVAALDRADRGAALTRVELAALTPDEARELLGGHVDAADATAIYEACGGNPFYLEQLARSLERAGGPLSAPEPLPAGVEVPPAVAASLGEELALLSSEARLVLEGAAVAGDPFEPELAAAAAAVSESAALEAVDELFRADLVRTTDVPRRFRFRHPLVRHAVYEATAAGWRLGAHERCAGALADRGVASTARAHHIERSARQGDVVAAATLREAGEAAARLAPESAARWFEAALHLLPETTTAEDRIELLLLRARALAAAGHFAASHEALLGAVAVLPDHATALRTTVATSCAAVERQLGRYELAHDRLVRALRSLPDPASVESVELLVELTLNEFYRSRYEAMHEWAERAASDATSVPDAPLTASAMVMSAFAFALTGPLETAELRCTEAAAMVDALSDSELSLRPDAAAWLSAAELYLDRYTQADAHGTRALELARATGRGDPLFRLYPILPRIWYVRGKLAEAAELVDGAIEGGRLLGSPPALAGNLFNSSVIALAVGDLDLALAAAEEGGELAQALDEGFVPAWAAVRLAGVLLEVGDPARAIHVLLARAGGDELVLIPGGWRVYCLELLTRCWLALDQSGEAERSASLAEQIAESSGLPLPRAWASRAAAAVALHAGATSTAIAQATASAEAAHGVGAPIESALARTLAGRAFAEDGQGERAVEELRSAAATFDACGALRYREVAERELGRLGHRPYRRSRRGNADGTGIETLTERQVQVAQLVVERKTNSEIAAQLFLSEKTVEAHLHNIFRKVGVNTRVQLAHMVLRADDEAAAARARRG
jgi:DNA-binding CsgD family transcriptional regulator